MLLRPRINDFRIIGFYLGRIIIGLCFFMLIPMGIALVIKEYNPFLDILISFLFCISIGLMLHVFCYTKEDLKWSHGMIVVSLSWLVAAAIGAVPLFLSGHFSCFLDAYFESMSGFSTTGLTLANDLAHMSYAHNLWRHIITFIGGQGIAVVVLSLFIKGASGAMRMFVGEARDEHVLPNVRQTTRFIWLVSFVFLILGTLALGITAFNGGIPFWKAMFHGACVFMSAFDTAGFTPQQQNIIYYHNATFEIIAMVLMILGAFNFQLHFLLWSGKYKEITKDFESRLFFVSVLSISAIVIWGLSRLGSYPSAEALFRKGFFQVVSAHTTTGFQTIYNAQFMHEWGSLPILALIFAMSLGGAVCSTAGGIKMLRCGIVGQAFLQDVKRMVLPEATVFFKKIHHVKDMILTDKQIRSACLIVIAYLSMFFIGGVIGMMSGYSFIESFFESTSASVGAGLSCGIVSPSMPAVLKITYIVQMWAGRLEFMSVFALIGFVWILLRGK